MLIGNREYSDPELKSYIMGLQKRIADAENLNSELKKKNAELKEFLKLAVSELEASMDRDEYDCCDTCKHKDEHPCHPSYNCYEWEYKEQALKLIGGDDNAVADKS